VRRWLAETGVMVVRETNRQWRSFVWGKRRVADGMEWWHNGGCGTQMTTATWKEARRWLTA